MLGGAVGFALLYWFMADLPSPRHRSAVAVGVVGAVTAWLVIFAIRWSFEKVDWVANGGGMPNLLESAQTLLWLTTNAVPALTLLGIGFLVFLPRDAGARLLTIVFVVASVLTVPMSGGRAAWLGLLVAGVAWWALGKRWLLERVTTRVVLALAALIAAVPFAVAALDISGPYITGLSARLPLWDEATAILAANPITGGGPGSFAWLRLEHVPPGLLAVPAVMAHDVPLQTAADGGLLLLVGLALIVGAVLAATWKDRLSSTEPQRRVVAVLLGFGAASLLDDHSSLPAITAMVVTLAAWATVPADAQMHASQMPQWHRPLLLAVVGVLAAVSLVNVARVDLARLSASTARGAAVDGDLAAAQRAFGEAAGWYPENAQYRLSLGVVSVLQGQDDIARDAYERAIELAPGDARAWAGLAAMTAEPEDRQRLLTQATLRPSADPQYALRLARELEAAGQSDAAVDAYAQALARLPAIIVAVDGASTDVPTLVQSTLATVDELGPLSRLNARQIAADFALAGVNEGANLPAAWQVVQAIQRADLGAAEDALFEAIGDEGWSATTWLAAEALAMHECDARRTDQISKLLNLLPGSRSRAYVPGLVRAYDQPYREEGLGDYQPVEPVIPAPLTEWPGAYLDPPAAC
jgi:O-antigen ligase